MIVYTGGLAYLTVRAGHADGLDVRRYSANDEGKPFAPSRALLDPYLAARRARIWTRAQADRAWANFAALYEGELIDSATRTPEPWDRLTARPTVTLCCACPLPDRCHRRVLALFLGHYFGARYEGERGTP